MFKHFFIIVLIAATAIMGCSGVAQHIGTASYCKVHEKAKNDIIFLKKETKTVVNSRGETRTTVHLLEKILTYKGKKEHAHYKINFNQEYEAVHVISARTIKPDNTMIPVKGEWIHEIMAPWTASASVYSHYRQKIIDFPGVEVGDRVEITYKISRKPMGSIWGRAIFQGQNPVRAARFELITPRQLKLFFYGHVGSTFKQEILPDGRVRRIWYGAGIEGLPRQVFQPSPENLYPTLFYCSARGWKDVGKWFASYLLPDLKETGLQKLLSSADPWNSPDELYRRLVKRLTILDIKLNETTYRVADPVLILKRDYGDSKDASAVFFELLRAKGFNPQLVLYNEDDIFLDDLKAIPSPGLFNQVMVSVDGSFYQFSGADGYNAPGFTNRMGRWALLLPSCKLERIRSRSANEKKSRMILDLRVPGEVQGNILDTLNGSYGVELREALKDVGPEEKSIFWDTWLNNLDPLAALSSKPEVVHLLDFKIPPEIRVNYTVPRAIPAVGAGLFFLMPPGDRFTRYITLNDHRIGALAVNRTVAERVTLEVRYPAPWKIERLPPDITIESPCFSGAVRIERPSPGILRIFREIRMKRGLIRDIKAYYLFCRAVRSALGLSARFIVFQRSSTVPRQRSLRNPG